ncbi:MAG: TolC family protein [Desulfarculaceae bacterium]|nr:TolC family protein [Desulfarculaceae bacterium]
MHGSRLGALALLLLAMLAAGPAGAEQVLSLDQAVGLALKKNPTLEAARQEVAQAEGRVTQATSRWFPQLNATADYTRNYSDRSRTSNYSGNYNYYDTGLTLTQKIYDFGQTGGKVEASRQELSATQHDLGTRRDEVVLAVRASYFEVLKNQRLVKVAVKTLASQQRHLEQAKGFYATGLRPKIDVARASVDLANARLALISAQYRQREARVALERIMGGRPWKSDYALASEKGLPPLPGKLDPLLAEALAQRPEMASVKALVAASQGRLESAQGGYWPSLDAGGSYQYGNTELPLENNWEAGVGLSWSIFSGFLTKGQVNEARAQILQRKARLRELELGIGEEVEQAWLVVRESLERIEVARTALEAAEENFRLSQGRYDNGVGNAIEFTDAQVSRFQAASDLVKARYNYLQAFAALERALGRPLAASKIVMK